MKSFRYDINALRAVAVMSVILFHYSPVYLPGGFVGVDVFFVISGYLMTSIIMKNIDGGYLNYKSFILARSRRIIPALLAMLMVFTCVSYFTFYSFADFQLAIKHAISSIMFTSNFTYWLESGYFDELSSRKLFLHTWSLSAEWQFYLLYPFVLLLFKNFFKDKIAIFVLIATTILFFLNLYFSNNYPSAAYYLLPSRAWEMMFGACAYFYSFDYVKNSHKRVMVVLCLLSIILSFLVFTDSDMWPGYKALFPVLATAILISVNSSNKLFKNPLLYYVGKWSYSLYLWHWPLIVFINEGYIAVDLFLPLLIVCSLGSFYFVEQINWKGKTVIPLTIVTIAFLYLSLGMIVKGDRSAEYSEKAVYMNNAIEEKALFPVYSRRECNFRHAYKDDDSINRGEISPTCYTSKKEKSLLLWGDSHAFHLYYGLNYYLKDQPVDILQVTTSSCRISYKGKNKDCNKSNQFFWEVVEKERPDVVLISQRNQYEKIDFSNVERRLSAFGVNKVIVLGPSPEFQPTLRDVVVRGNLIGVKYIPPENSEQLQIDNDIKDGLDDTNIRYISMFDSLCNNTGCITYVEDQNDIFLVDSGHFSRSASKFVVKTIVLPEIEDLWH